MFSYDPETGDLCRHSTNRVINKPSTGYRECCIWGKWYKAHRIIWCMVTGEWPTLVIDHKNGDGLDNRWANLREATLSQNQQNSKKQCNNKSGFKGVSQTASGRYSAQIVANQRCVYLGLFDSPVEAHQAYLKAAQTFHGEFARAE